MSERLALSAAQRRHIQRLVLRIQEGDAGIAAAQKLRDAAQQGANEYILYMADELGIADIEGWNFDQQTMSFVFTSPNSDVTVLPPSSSQMEIMEAADITEIVKNNGRK